MIRNAGYLFTREIVMAPQFQNLARTNIYKLRYAVLSLIIDEAWSGKCSGTQVMTLEEPNNAPGDSLLGVKSGRGFFVWNASNFVNQHS
jgi:hypothetical protein